MSHRLLFVCAMNVCRSPLMAFTFAEALAEDSDRTGWTVTSRGTGVSRRQSMCEVSGSLIGGTEAGDAFAKSHVSNPVVASQLNTQDLIVVATKSERGKLAQISPGLRGRTFTLREAIALGGAPLTGGEIDMLARGRTSGHKERLSGYPELLNSRRGTVIPPQPRKSLWPWREDAADPFDLADVHHEKLKVHLGTLKQLQTDIRVFHGQLAGYLRERAAD